MKKENPKANKLLAVMVSATLATGMVPAIALADDDGNQPARKSVSEMIEEVENGQNSASNDVVLPEEEGQAEDAAEPQSASGIATQAADSSDRAALVDSITSKGGSIKSDTYTLDQDIEFVEDNLTVPAGEVVTIDLNGKTLKGNGTSSVIAVYGELVINDSSGNNSGKITGGVGVRTSAGWGGGGISLEPGSKTTLNAGSITENHCDISDKNFNGGGGVYVKGASEFIMNGGCITSNTSSRQGGGIFAGGGSTLVMNGGVISNNASTSGGGVCFNNTFTMNGGSITGNTAKCIDSSLWNAVMGGGVKVNGNNPFEFYGGEITNNIVEGANSVSAQGAGIHAGNSAGISTEGLVKVSGNKIDGVEQNVFLGGTALITLQGDLSAESKLPVTRSSVTGRVSNNNGFNSFDAITSDDATLSVKTKDGNVFFTKEIRPEDAYCSVVSNGEVVYLDSFAAAVAELPTDNNTITLLKDMELDQQIVSPANSSVVINADNPVKITWANPIASYFSIPASSELSITGDVTIEGNNNAADGITGYKAFDVRGTLNLGEENSNKGPVITSFKTASTGGAVQIYSGATLRMYSGSITGNTANYGAGIYSVGEVILEGGSISDNHAIRGGGIYNTSSLVVNGGTIAGNIAEGASGNQAQGGGIYSNGTAVMNGGAIENNRVVATLGNVYGEGRGAGVFNTRGSFTFNDGSISRNYCEAKEGVSFATNLLYCAGLYNDSNGQATINGGLIEGNYYKANSSTLNGRSTLQGVGVTNNGAHMVINGGTIKGNGITSESGLPGVLGAGVASAANSQSDSYFEMNGGSIIENNSGTSNASALYIPGDGNSAHTSNVVLRGGNIAGNIGNYAVTGLGTNCNVSLEGNVVIKGNKDASGIEKNIYLPNGAAITLSNPLTSGATIGVTTQKAPTDSAAVQVTSSEADTELYKDAAKHFVPDAQGVVSQANETGKYVEFAKANETYFDITLDLTNTTTDGALVTRVKQGDPFEATITPKEGYSLPESIEGVTSYLPSSDGSATIGINSVDREKTISVASVPNTYKIAFNANEGTGDMASIEGVYDSDIALPSNEFTRANYTFGGWNTEADGSGTSYADAATVRSLTAENGATVTLYAQWKEKPAITIDDTPQSFNYDATAHSFEIKNAPVSDGFSVSYVPVTGARAAAISNPVDAGVYDVVVTRAEDATYQSFSKTIPGGLVINKATDRASVSLADKEVTYTGSPIEAAAAVVTVEGQVESAAQVTYKYYSDQACQNELSGAPADAGTYYVKAFWAGDNNHEAAESVPAKLNIMNASFNVVATGWSGTYDGQPHSVTVESSTEGVTVLFGESADSCTLNESPKYTEPGEYTVYYRASLANYNDVEGSVKVVIKEAVVPTPVNPGTSSEPGATTTTTTTTSTTAVTSVDSVSKAQSSKTGDNVMVIAGAIALIGAAAISLGVVALRRLRNNR